MISPSRADSTSRLVSCASSPPSPVSCSPPSRARPASRAISCSSTASRTPAAGRHRLAADDLVQVHDLARASGQSSGATSLIGVTPLFLQSLTVGALLDASGWRWSGSDRVAR